jgi:UDPglucose 6-dehydrogenase
MKSPICAKNWRKCGYGAHWNGFRHPHWKALFVSRCGLWRILFPKDVQALAKTAEENTYDFRILKSVMKVNREQKKILTGKIRKYFGDDLSGKTIAIWGLSFKPETDDIREAPALTIIEGLLEAGAKIQTYDPEAMDNVREIFGDRISFSEDQYEALDNADALAVITEWSVFRTPDYAKIKEKLKSPRYF